MITKLSLLKLTLKLSIFGSLSFFPLWEVQDPELKKCALTKSELLPRLASRKPEI